MIEPNMVGLYSLLLALLMAIERIIEKMDLSKQRKTVKKVWEFISHLQTIINDAEKIFNLIKHADEQIREYGEDKFTKIIQDNFKDQLFRLHDIEGTIYNRDMSIVIEKFDNQLKWQFRSMFDRKSGGITEVMKRLTFSKLRYENGQLYTEQDKKLVFPNFDRQYEILTELKQKNKSFEQKFYAIAEFL